MKRDPYALIKAALARRMGGVVIRPSNIPVLRAVALDNRRRAVKILSVKSTSLS